MITLRHSLISLFALKGDVEEFKKEIPYILLPDAIRKYSGPRQYSHFEQTEDGSDISWMKFPKYLKDVTPSGVEAMPKHLSEGIRPCVIGEKTHVSKFEETNGHLGIDYFYGVKKHLVQDDIFDDFTREKIETSKRYEDEFEFNGEKMDGKQTRRLITDMENHGLYILSYMLYKAYGITTNQQWFDENVKTVLDAAYPQELSDSTYQYMQIPEELDKKITEHDWSEIDNGLIPTQEYRKMYEKISKEMVEIDYERIAKKRERAVPEF